MSPAVSSWSNGGKRRAARVLIPLMPQGDNDSLLTLAHWLAEAQVPVMLVGIVPVPEGENLTVGAAAARELRKRIQAHVDRVYLRAKARIRVTYTPWDDLRMVALRERVDMLVLDWPRHLEVLQLTAAELLSHPPADILLLRGPLRTPPQRILIPNRGGPHAELALRLALLLSRQFGSRVTSLRLRSEEPDHQEDLDFAGMRQILQAMPDVRQETLASDDKPAALVEAARGYDLVIVGTAARPTASTTSFGAIADRLLADAPCPVLAVKTRRVALEREDPRRFGAHAISVLVDRWFAENTFHSDEFADLKRLVRLKEERGVTISLALPALNEEETIGPIIRTCQRALMEQVPLLDEIVLMDSNSTDRTREIAQDLGIPVYIHQQVLPQYGAREGKGEALWKSLYVTKGDLIIWVDTDIRNFHPRFVYGLIGALLYRTKLMLVKGFYRRPLKTGQGLQPLPRLQRSAVETFDQHEFGAIEQRADEAVHEAWVKVADVGVHPNDEVALGHIQALPQGLAFALARAVLGQHLLVDVDGNAQVLGNLPGAVRGVGVHEHDFVQQRHLLHERALAGADDRADGLFFVQRGEGQTDGHPALLFEAHQAFEVRELVGMKSVLREPAVHQHRDGVRAEAAGVFALQGHAAGLDGQHRTRRVGQQAVGDGAERGGGRGGAGRSAHDDQVVAARGLHQRGRLVVRRQGLLPHIGHGLQNLPHAREIQVLLVVGLFGAQAQGSHPAAELPGQQQGQPQGQLRVRPAPVGDEDALRRRAQRSAQQQDVGRRVREQLRGGQLQHLQMAGPVEHQHVHPLAQGHHAQVVPWRVGDANTRLGAQIHPVHMRLDAFAQLAGRGRAHGQIFALGHRHDAHQHDGHLGLGQPMGQGEQAVVVALRHQRNQHPGGPALAAVGPRRDGRAHDHTS